MRKDGVFPDMNMVRFLFMSALLFFAALSTPRAQELHQDKVESSTRHMNHNGQSLFEISASGFARASQEQTWRVLTDYDRLTEFVPDLETSTLISRAGEEVIVKQRSKAGFLFLSQTIHLVVRIIERPYSGIDVALVSGDMRQYSAQWQLAPATHDGIDGTRIIYTATMEPDFFAPPLFTRPMVNASVKRTIEAVVAEIERRNADE